MPRFGTDLRFAQADPRSTGNLHAGFTKAAGFASLTPITEPGSVVTFAIGSIVLAWAACRLVHGHC